MYKLRFYFQNFRFISSFTLLKLIVQANEDIILKDTPKICKTKTIGDNYYLISEYDRVKKRYNYIKLFEKV